MGHPDKFQRVSRLGSVIAQHSSSGHHPNFAALNRGRHLYSAGRPSRWALATFLVLSFYLLLLLSFFPHLISAVGDWMSAILLHMVWPCCEFRMQVYNVLRAARWKCRTQKIAKNRHMGTIAQICRAICSQLRHVSTIGKKAVEEQFLPHIYSQYGDLRPTYTG